ncbi:hypothetical protein FH972_026877 [Carpinus fangiana]|uniref:RNA 3'-terminal phosphate cyclase domain-containing protein n=1 Tax=Carpinus fangiana TaxID=176857 RepID=A0A5N6L5A0_9ROSI|nr:hypothetical protein FH972_026877 [Carpinus fangiana]
MHDSPNFFRGNHVPCTCCNKVIPDPLIFQVSISIKQILHRTTGKIMKHRTIDASHLEGGGQVVRIAATLSALTSVPITLTNIRGNRSGGGGLKGQHLTSVQWLAKACNARVEGLELRSRTLVFEPGLGNVSRKERDLLVGVCNLEDGTQALRINISLETNGAATLVLQTLLPYLLFCPPTHAALGRSSTPILLTIEGGTNVPLSPSIDYLLHVFSPNLVRFGLDPIRLISLSRGYTTGARSALGSVSLLIQPLVNETTLAPFSFLSKPPQPPQSDEKNPALQSIEIHILAPTTAAIDALRSSTLTLIQDTFFPGLLSGKPKPVGSAPRVQVTTSSSNDASNKRFYLLLVGIQHSGFRIGADWLYDGKGLRSGGTERKSKRGGADGEPADVLSSVAREMAAQVVGELGNALLEGREVDQWMEDQLVVFRSLATADALPEGTVSSKIEQGDGVPKPSLHTITAQWIAQELLGVEFDQSGACKGVGLVAV